MTRIPKSEYFINEKGEVFNKHKQQLKIKTKNGGAQANVLIDGKRRLFPIWKLLQITFMRKLRKGEVIRVIDDNIFNTCLSNYEIINIEELGKVIEGYEDYIVSKDGCIFSTKHGRLKKMSTYYTKNGYEMIHLCKNNITKKKQVHRLVAEAYIENPLNKDEVDHIDSNTKNNDYKNLRWSTRKENMGYSFEKNSPTRNYVKNSLVGEDGFIKSFKTKKECCEYAKEHFNCSYSSLMKYGYSNRYKILIEEPQTTIESIA